ncbi:hypothetical protein AB0K18_35505 [Nonomuraea sp. NPDC049421]|uniref:hypothetical protein n=1 Tax=Nonomuraea sp. NPDC049421 TaxID=3155275 RepID=UPI003448F70B
MRALVVYESMYGNTQQVARVVADGPANRDAGRRDGGWGRARPCGRRGHAAGGGWSHARFLHEQGFYLHELQGQEGVDTLCAFLRAIGSELDKPVLIAPEGGGREDAVLGFDPVAGKFVLLGEPAPTD